jgi:hypothetical protein
MYMICIPILPVFSVQRCTDLRSVTWTKVSLKDAKILATPKTSSPVALLALCNAKTADGKGGDIAGSRLGKSLEEWEIFTISDLGAEGDVLLGGACSFLWRHGEFMVLVIWCSISEVESSSDFEEIIVWKT